MALFCHRCIDCGFRFETFERENEFCRTCGSFSIARDWRSEGVGVAVANLKADRERGGEADKRLFLPHNDDFKGPDDPDGTKGMREWRDNHQPKAGNKRPDWPGTVERKVM
jgi:hypothetical protein